MTAATPATTAEDVAQLLADGLCAPQCLLALQPETRCGCRCSGQFHGALIVRPGEENGGR
jgi:hypothetical protein